MVVRISETCDVAHQESGKDPEGRFILSVLAKRTYAIQPDGSCMPAERQIPLIGDPIDDQDNPELLVHDTDFFPYKPLTDVVVRGHAYGYNGRRRFEAVVRVESFEKRLLVIGDRQFSVDSAYHIKFFEPDPVEKVPLRYSHAYGGFDEVAEAKYGNPFIEELGAVVDPETVNLRHAGLFHYPRNPAGRGYIVEATRDSLADVVLPNLEDPADPLTPERLVLGDAGAWPRMPLPQATDWVSYAWFPRHAYFGVVPLHAPLSGPIAEVVRNHVPANLMDMPKPTPESVFRLSCGASLGLQLPYLRGGERVLLEGIHPTQSRFVIELPADRPRMWTDGRQGRFNETEPVLHTVVIDADRLLMTLLWRGSAPALRPYLVDELEKMPFRLEFPH